MSFSESPTVRALARAALAGILVGLGALVAATAEGGVSGHEWATVAYTAVGGFGTFFGIGAATPLEPFVGWKPAKLRVSVPREAVKVE
jgi:formate/nitrite transporter FocA (FNT family)